MSVIKGGDLMLFVNGTSIGYATSHTLSMSADTKETSTKDSGGKWQTSEVGILSWSVTSENLYSNDQNGIGFSDLFTMYIARTPITGVFSLETDSPNFEDGKLSEVPDGGWSPKTGGYVGQMVITSIELNADNGENASFSVQFQGTGQLRPFTSHGG